MIKQSDEFNTAFTKLDRTLSVRMFINDDITPFMSEDIVSIEYDSAAYTGDTFGIGSTYENTIKVVFSELQESIHQNDILKPQIGIQLPDGTFEYTPLGVFIVSDQIEQDRNNEQTTITALDKMVYLEGAYTPSTKNIGSVRSWVLEIANMAGVVINEDNIGRLSTEISIAPITNQTYRTALGMLAQFIGGYVVFNRAGELELRGLSDTIYPISPDNYEFQGLTKSETPYLLSGISCDVTVTSTADPNSTTTKTLHTGKETGSQVALTNPSMIQSLLDDILTKLQGLTFYPYTLNWFGNPAVEAGDFLEIEDTKGNKFTVPNNSYILTFDGSISAVSSTSETVVSDNSYSYQGSLNQTLSDIKGHLGANGNIVYTDTSEPAYPHENDVWYKPVNGKIEMYIYENGEWVLEASDLSGSVIQKQIDEAVKEIDNAKVLADTANRTAQKAQDDATNALDNLTVIDNKVTELSSSVTEQINTLNDGYQQILVNEDGLTNQITNITGVLDTKVSSDQYETDRLQTDKIISDVVKDVAGNTTQINQLSDNINLMVQKDDIINQINISKEGILIDGQKVHITGQTVIDNAVIKDAMISNISADKLTAGTINANLINVVNLNGANIVANTISGDKMTADAIQVGFQRMGSTIRISPTELSFWNGGNRSLSLQKDGMHIIDSDNNEDVGLIHTNSIAGYPQYNGLNFDLNPKGDYMAWGSRTSTGDNFTPRLAWVRAGMASSTGFSAGLNIIDQVTFGKGINIEGVPSLMNFKKVTFNGGTYPYFGNDNIKAGFLYGTTQIYMSSDGIGYNLTPIVKALAGFGDAVIPVSIRSDGTIATYKKIHI